MGASLYIGKELRFETPGEDGGQFSLVGAPLWCENMSWTSISELTELCETKLGISPEDWPFYGDVQLEEEFPLDDARAKCALLREQLGRHAIDTLPENRWLRALARWLRDGYDFCAKSW